MLYFYLCKLTAPGTGLDESGRWGGEEGLLKEEKFFNHCHSDCEQLKNGRCVQLLIISAKATGYISPFMSPQGYTFINCALQRSVNFREFSVNVYKVHSGAQRSNLNSCSFSLTCASPTAYSTFNFPSSNLQGSWGGQKTSMPNESSMQNKLTFFFFS